MFGGNIITGLLKHGKMASAEGEIYEARYALQKFSKEIRDVHGFSFIHIGDFMTFADFFFDGIVMDIIVQFKISDAKRQCDQAIRQVEDIRRQLVYILGDFIQGEYYSSHGTPLCDIISVNIHQCFGENPILF